MHTYLRNMIKYRDLFIELVKKDIKIKYRNSFLGIIWSMINPLMFLIVISLIFSSLFTNTISNYPFYVLVGRMIYLFFSESTNFAMDSIHANGQLIRKVYVPKYYFPLSRICSTFITTIVTFTPILLVLIIVTNSKFNLVSFFIIIPLIYILLISMGVGLFLSAVNVFFRDIKHLYSVILMFIMYASAIFYPIEIVPNEYRIIFDLNPIYKVIEMARDVLLNGSLPSIGSHLIVITYTIILLVLGFYTFYKTQDKFIQKI